VLRLKVVLLSTAASVVIPLGHAGISREPHYEAADLRPIMSVRLPGHQAYDRETGPFRLANIEDKTLRLRLRRAGFQSGYTKVWNHEALAGEAYLFRTSSGAQAALAALRAYDERWLLTNVGKKPQSIRTAGLGDDAWGLKEVSYDGSIITEDYSWRKGNLVLATVLRCDVCPNNLVVGVSRGYANALDARATQISRRSSVR